MYRREFVAMASGTALAVCLAGCLGGNNSGDDSGADDGSDTIDDDRDDNGSNTTGDNSDNESDTVDDDSDDSGSNTTDDDSDSDDESAETTASFTWRPPEPSVQTPIELDASASTGDIVEYRWDVDDDRTIETSTTSQVTTHRFDETGDLPVTLEAETVNGETATTTEEVPVGGVKAAFVVNPPEPRVDATTTFTATESAGNIVEYRWDFTGDGNVDEVTTGSTTTHVFEETGPTTVTLEVESADGQTDTASLDIAVGETAPFLNVAFEWEPLEPVVGEEVTFDATGSAGDIVEYRWDFTDNGSFDAVSESPTATHTFEGTSNRFVVVTLEIEASDGDTASGSTEIPVLKENPDPPAPEAAFDWTPLGVLEGEEITFQAFETTGDIVEYRWDFTDNGNFEAVSGGATATHTFTDITGETTKVVTLEVEDSQGRTDTVSQEVPIEEDPGPGATFNWTPSDPDPGEEVTFDATDSVGDIVEYRWDFDNNGEVDATTDNPTVTHTFESKGLAPVTLEIQSENGKTAQTTREIPVSE